MRGRWVFLNVMIYPQSFPSWDLLMFLFHNHFCNIFYVVCSGISWSTRSGARCPNLLLMLQLKWWTSPGLNPVLVEHFESASQLHFYSSLKEKNLPRVKRHAREMPVLFAVVCKQTNPDTDPLSVTVACLLSFTSSPASMHSIKSKTDKISFLNKKKSRKADDKVIKHQGRIALAFVAKAYTFCSQLLWTMWIK